MAMIGPYALLVPNGVIQNSSDVFYILDPDTGGAATFSVKLSATGLAPVTYWGAYTLLEEATYNALTTMTVQQFKAYVDQKAAEHGRPVIGSVTAFKNSVLISPADVDFWTFAASNGLQVIQEQI
jgi:hypothetical protein